MQIFKLPTAGTFANFEIHFLTKSASSQSFCIIHIYLFLTFSLRSVTHTPQQPDSTALQFQRVHTLLHRWWPGLVLTHEQVNICLARLIFFFKRQLLFFCLASHRLPHFTFKPGLLFTPVTLQGLLCTCGVSFILSLERLLILDVSTSSQTLMCFKFPIRPVSCSQKSHIHVWKAFLNRKLMRSHMNAVLFRWFSDLVWYHSDLMNFLPLCKACHIPVLHCGLKRLLSLGLRSPILRWAKGEMTEAKHTPQARFPPFWD